MRKVRQLGVTYYYCETCKVRAWQTEQAALSCCADENRYRSFREYQESEAGRETRRRYRARKKASRKA